MSFSWTMPLRSAGMPTSLPSFATASQAALIAALPLSLSPSLTPIAFASIA